MTQLTVRGFDEDLEQAIRELAESEGVSLNRAAVKLMRRGAGIDADAGHHDCIGHSLDHLFGNWTEEEAQEFNEAVKWFDRIDEEMWR